MATASGGEGYTTRNSWATVLGRSLIPGRNRNVLEVVLEKESKGSYRVSDIECAKFLGKIGLDVKSGGEIEGIQICPNGRGVKFITLKEQVDMSKYFRYDVIEVS